jgi:hypothetical protein
MLSTLTEVGPVTFPAFRGERHYMIPFKQRDGLPPHLRHWQPTVDAMLAGVRTEGPIYLMVDQSRVEAGQTQRRPGLHVDGNWIAATASHGGHRHANYAPETVILASDVEGCRAYVGEFDVMPSDGGDCSHFTPDAAPVTLRPHVAYAGNASMLHESIPLRHGARRTLVRLNVPGVLPNA